MFSDTCNDNKDSDADVSQRADISFRADVGVIFLIFQQSGLK